MQEGLEEVIGLAEGFDVVGAKRYVTVNDLLEAQL